MKTHKYDEAGSKAGTAAHLYARSESEVELRTTRRGLSLSLKLRDPTQGQLAYGQHTHAP